MKDSIPKMRFRGLRNLKFSVGMPEPILPLQCARSLRSLKVAPLLLPTPTPKEKVKLFRMPLYIRKILNSRAIEFASGKTSVSISCSTATSIYIYIWLRLYIYTYDYRKRKYVDSKARFPLGDFFRAKRLLIVKIE